MATVDLFKKIVEQTPASSDREHLHILIDNNPSIPDRTESILSGGPRPVNEILKSATMLEKMGADFVVMPCNTAHYYYDQIQAGIQIPLLNMIQITAEACKESGLKTVGLLSTTGTVKTNLYQNAFHQVGLTCLSPTEADQETVMRYIYAYKAGEPIPEIRPLRVIVEQLQLYGAECIVLGCTELPLILTQKDSALPLLDPTLQLANAAVQLAM